MNIISDFVRSNVPDVFLLQEVPVFEGTPVFPAAFQELGYNHVYLSSGQFGPRTEGIAVCTKEKSTLLGGILLAEGKDRRGRTALAVGIQGQNGELRALAVTTHLANGDDNVDARKAETSEISAMIAKIWTRFGRVPTVLTGDFNCTADEAAVQLLVDPTITPALRDAQAEFGLSQVSTLDSRNKFAADHPRANRRIDYIFLSDEWKISDFRIVFNDTVNGRFASDHYGLFVVCELAD